MLLKVNDMHSYYGKSHILQGIGLAVEGGEIVCLLGRNGAGKSTTLKSIIGLVPPRSGSVKFSGTELRGLAPYTIA